LKTHDKTGEKPYECFKCGKSFWHKTSLKDHLKKNHSEGQNDKLSSSVKTSYKKLLVSTNFKVKKCNVKIEKLKIYSTFNSIKDIVEFSKSEFETGYEQNRDGDKMDSDMRSENENYKMKKFEIKLKKLKIGRINFRLENEIYQIKEVDVRLKKLRIGRISKLIPN